MIRLIRGFAFGIAFLAVAAAAAQVAAEPGLVVRLERGGAAGEVTISVRAPGGEELTARVAPEAGGEVAVAVPGAGPWRVEARAEGFWSPAVEVAERGAEVELRLWPAGTLETRLEPPRGERLPREVTIELTRPEEEDGGPGSDGLAAAVLTCRVAEDGDLRCPAPAGRWQLVLRSAGFVPLATTKAESVPVGDVLRFGPFTLTRGVTVIGRVVVDAAELDPAAARVELRPVVADLTSGRLAPDRGRRHLGREVAVSRDGDFEIPAVPPGAYELVATHPGCEPAARVVEIGVERPVARIEPIVVRPPLRLGVVVSPPTSGRKAWRVELLGVRTGDLEGLEEGTTDEEGRWRSRRLPAGPYTVRVLSPEGAAMAWEEIELAPGRDEVEIELALVRVTGEVRIGEEPLAAKLWFGGRFGAQRVPAESDLDGLFAVVLPRPGSWRVDVEGLSRPVHVSVAKLEISPPRLGRASEVEIVLPETMIEGSVRDRKGEPVAGAEVFLLPLGDPSGATSLSTDGLGRFEIEGQPPGSYAVEASDATRRSERVEILIAEGLRSPPLELRLLEHSRLRGRVVGPEGPVAGAAVIGISLTTRGEMASSHGEIGKSGPDGAFELELPGDAARVRLVVTALGYALGAGTVAADGGEEVVVRLGRDGGRLEIPRPRLPGDDDGLPGLVLFGTEMLDPLLLETWARANRANADDPAWLAVPQMPAGPYAYCELPPESLFLVFTGAALPAAGACTEGYLPPGGVLRLAAPGG